MNILIKLMSIISLVIAPTLASLHHDSIQENREKKIDYLQSISKQEKIEQQKENWTLQTPVKTGQVQESVKSFIDVLTKDGLIKENSYSVAVQDGILYIDGVKQSSTLNEKYQKFITETGDFITKETK